MFAGRVALLALAAGAVVTGWVVSRRAGLEGRRAAGAAYACPMHPQVTAAAPGACSICGMVLTPARAAEAAKDGAGTGQAAAPEAPVGWNELVKYGLALVRPRVFTQEVRAPAWVEADGTVRALLYLDEIAALAPDEAGVFVPATGVSGAAAAAGASARRAAGEAAPWDASTAVVTFRFAPAATAAATTAPRPGDTGRVVIAARARELLVIPYEAVRETPDGPYVLVPSAGGGGGGEHGTEAGGLERRPIRIGRVFYGMAVVTAGLARGERFASDSAFFLDAEQRLRAGGAHVP